MVTGKMKTYELYGIKQGDLESARIAIEKILGIRLIGHESSYHGGNYYRLGDLGNEHFILQWNFDPMENEWTEEKYKEMPILFYINETDRPEELENLMKDQGFNLLRKERL
jgi:hypothetical protein